MHATLPQSQSTHRLAQLVSPQSRLVGTPHRRQPRDIVFISGDLDQVNLLTQNVLPGKDVIILHPAMDGMVQIARYVAAMAQPIRNLYLVAHGAMGELHLGETILSLETINQYSLALQMVKAHLTPDATISLYACNLACNLQGQQLVQMLHHLTGAEVGASTTVVGHVSQGGNWALDYATSGFRMEPVFSQDKIATYPHVLEIGTKGTATPATTVTVSIENLSPENGTFLTPSGSASTIAASTCTTGDAPYPLVWSPWRRMGPPI